jgi:hypothetical protein
MTDSMDLLAFDVLTSGDYIHGCRSRNHNEMLRVVSELWSVPRSEHGYLRLCLVEAVFARGDARIFEDGRNSHA